MSRTRLTSTVILVQLLMLTDVTAQFFDFFGFQPLVQQFQPPKQRTQTQYVSTETTRRPNTRKHNARKSTTVSYALHYPERDENIRHTSKEEKEKQSRRKTTVGPMLDFNFNLYTTTMKPVRKTTERSHSSQRHKHKNTNNSGHTTRNTIFYDDSSIDATTKAYGFDGDQKQKKTSNNKYVYYDKPISSNIADEYYNYTTRYHIETVTKSLHTYTEDERNENHNRNNNRNNNFYYVTDYNNNNQRHTTKNPLHRPGVKPAVIETRPPITNRPLNRPVTNRPTTKKAVAVFPRPTDAGSIAFPEDEDGPEIITGPNEDYMSDIEKRRHIEMAEKMCDKYKSLNTKQLQAIPLIPSPEPVQVNVSSCAPTTVPLVVGGKVVTINEFPHMALLGWVKVQNGGYSWKCGGSLISERYVLTAAHCAYQERDNTVIIGAPRVVQLGSSYLDDPGALVVRVAAVVRHPKYKSPRSYYDLALVKLVKPVMFSEVIRPACLGEPPRVGQPIIATGWGQTKFAGDQSLELRSVSLPVWDMQSCRSILGTSRKLPDGPMSESQMCAGDRRGGKDTCQGDSGGPAQLQEGCVWRVVAVTSLGRSCGAPNTPGLYAKVQRAFIAAQVFGGHSSGDVNNNRNNNGNNDYNYNRHDKVNNDDNRKDTVYNYNNNDKSNDNQYYNNPNIYTTEYTRRIIDYQSNFGDNYNTNNNNRYNRQESTENNNQQSRNGNHRINNHDNSNDNEYVRQDDNSKKTNQQYDYNNQQQQSLNYDTGYNQDVNQYNNQRHNQNAQNYDGGGDSQVDYNNDNNRNRDYKNNNQDYNKQQSSDDSRAYFEGPTWWTR